jgi:uncharacterized protein (TIGR03086 family)
VATENLETAIASTRSVLAGVRPDQLGDATPCAEWTVSGLINHIVGGPFFFAAALAGQTPAGDGPDFAAGDFLAAFDDGTTQCVAGFAREGAMEESFTLPFGTMTGAQFVNLATNDIFTHGWDLAKATGQSADLDAPLATMLLAGSRHALPDAVRNAAGNPFGFATEAPSGATAADELAAFLGRDVTFAP